MDISIILAWSGLAVSVIGIPLTYVFARRGRQRPDLRSATDFDVIVNPEDGILDRLNVEFDGTKILSVSRTRVAFWNERGDTVLGSDILPNDQLRLQVDSDDTILHVRIIAMSREQIDVACQVDVANPTRAHITFDFVDASDGFVLELLHTKAEPANLIGTIRGAVVASEKSRIDLSPSAIDKASEKWLLRLKHIGRKAVVSLAVLVGMIILITVATIYLTYDTFFSTPVLVDVSQFDLTQVAGQRDFADAVREAGNRAMPQLAAWGLIAYTVILIGMSLRTANSRYLRAAVPRSILYVRPDLSSNKTNPESELAAKSCPEIENALGQ